MLTRRRMMTKTNLGEAEVRTMSCLKVSDRRHVTLGTKHSTFPITASLLFFFITLLAIFVVRTESTCNEEQINACRQAAQTDRLVSLRSSGECIAKRYMEFSHLCSVTNYLPSVDYCCCNHRQHHLLCCRYHQDWNRFRCLETDDAITITQVNGPVGLPPLDILLPSILVPLLLLLIVFVVCFFIGRCCYRRRRRRRQRQQPQQQQQQQQQQSSQDKATRNHGGDAYSSSSSSSTASAISSNSSTTCCCYAAIEKFVSWPGSSQERRESSRNGCQYQLPPSSSSRSWSADEDTSVPLTSAEQLRPLSVSQLSTAAAAADPLSSSLLPCHFSSSNRYGCCCCCCNCSHQSQLLRQLYSSRAEDEEARRAREGGKEEGGEDQRRTYTEPSAPPVSDFYSIPCSTDCRHGALASFPVGGQCPCVCHPYLRLDNAVDVDAMSGGRPYSSSAAASTAICPNCAINDQPPPAYEESWTHTVI